MRFLRFIAFTLLFALAAVQHQPLWAQVPSVSTDTEVSLDRGARELETVRAHLLQSGGAAATSAEPDYEALRRSAIEVAEKAEAAVQDLSRRIASVQTTLDAIGSPAVGEPADLRSRRADLTRERDTLQATVKRARLLSLSANESADLINQANATTFRRNAFERVASPLSRRFWRELSAASADDLNRLSRFAARAREKFFIAMTPEGGGAFAAGLALAFTLVFPLKRRFWHVGRTAATRYAPETRARRAWLALWLALVGSATTVFAAATVFWTLMWTDALTEPATAFARELVKSVAFGAVIAALGEALLSVRHGTWRVLPVDDREAARLRPLPILAAFLTVVGSGVMDRPGIIGASQIANTLATLIFSLSQLGLLATILLALGKLRVSRDSNAGDITSRHSATSALMLLGWILLGTCTVLLLRGNVTLVAMICIQTVWMFAIATTAYLMSSAIEGLTTVAFSRSGHLGKILGQAFNVHESRLVQGALLLSAASKILIFLLAALLALAPLGQAVLPSLIDLPDLVTRAGTAYFSEIGAGLKGLGVLLAGLTGLHLFSGWLRDTFLPTTQLDAGTRTSIITIVRYAGFAAVTILATATIGVGLDRIGLVASALSVGIGFGLQAITQNFISGLILLAERPVKVGDTIRVGEEEGDVRRISVRSTEIRIADHSTLIIPNSDLITKSVRNMSLADPLGRIRIEFSTPAVEDADEVISMARTVIAAHPKVLEEPRPMVRLDSLAEEKIRYVATAFVSSPRAVIDVRSDILADLVRRLRMRACPAMQSTSDTNSENGR